MSKAVLVFSFDEPENSQTVGRYIEASKFLFKDVPDMKVYMATNESAKHILTILEPED